MRALLTALLLAACAHRPVAVAAPANVVATPWCAWASARVDGELVAVYACTETEVACEIAVQQARSTFGAMAGIRAVSDCEGPL